MSRCSPFRPAASGLRWQTPSSIGLRPRTLAGVALVFPVMMLMQMMSAGAMGGGISSAIARALGAGRRDDADALGLHSLAIAVIFGLVFMLGVLGGGPWLYGEMGGRGGSLAAALTYSNVVFSSAILIWLFN
jgi:Na+-driven multidrug efflux pump